MLTAKPISILLFFATFVLMACQGMFEKRDDNNAVARVGENVMYKEDLIQGLPKHLSSEDSAVVAQSLISSWASKELLLERSKINLPNQTINDFEKLIEDYRKDLYTKAYLEALVLQNLDTTVTQNQLMEYYEQRKEDFKLSDVIVQLRFAMLPQQFLNRDEVERSLRQFNEGDKRYLDSISVQFNKLHINDSIWVTASQVRAQIPPISYENQKVHLRKSQFFELQDTLGVYLGMISNVLDVNEVAPFEFVSPRIKNIILNRRRVEKQKELEKDLIDEAIKSKDFEVYEP